MRKTAQVNSDGSLKVSVHQKLLQANRTAHIWYTNTKVSAIAPVILAIIDMAGFYMLTKITFNTNPVQQGIIIAALAVAFEGAPLYIGYALCLKCNNVGTSIHNYVLAFSVFACLLGIVANTVFRIMTKNMVAPDDLNFSLAVAILMCILPVITSLINLVIGCLAFDPLLMDLKRLSKKLAGLRAEYRNITGLIETLENDDNMKLEQLDSETEYYTATKARITATQARLYAYIDARVSAAYNNKPIYTTGGDGKY